MIARIDISGTNLEIEADVAKYIERKIGRLDRYIPRNARKAAHAVVTLKSTENQTDSKYACEVVLHVPGDTITAKESTLNKFAAVDIVEAKLKNQLAKYKQTRNGHIKARRGVLRRVRERWFAAQPE